MNTPFDQFLAAQAPMATKSAAEIQAENAYWDDLTWKYASDENTQIETLFNTAFDDEISKLASQDPEFADILMRELAENAFNAGYAATRGGQ